MRLFLCVIAFCVCFNLQARYDNTDTQTSVTLEQANKNAEEAENKKQNYILLSAGTIALLSVVVFIRKRKRTTI